MSEEAKRKIMREHVNIVIKEQFKNFAGVECADAPDETVEPMADALLQFTVDHDQFEFEKIFMPLLREFVVKELNKRGIKYHDYQN
jgi:hypothetical protein